MQETKSGAELIAEERQRQISQEGFDVAYDDDEYHQDGELAAAAVCYATPEPLYVLKNPDFVRHGEMPLIRDPWPEAWDEDWDKRERDYRGRLVFDGRTRRSRIRDLAKAGALIAAEIDRLLRQRSTEK